jgi:hypothetical protein
MNEETDPRFAPTLEEWRGNPDVIGVALHGSRGVGSADEHSDFDTLLIVPEGRDLDEMYNRLRPPDPIWDLWPLTLTDLKRFADEPDEWTPGMMDTRVVLDKTGELTAILATMGRLDPERARKDAAGVFDAYLNCYIRSIKAARKGYRLGAHLHATESMNLLLRTLFAVNGWVAPYMDRVSLHWHKLEKLPCPLDELQERIERILQTGDAREQIELEGTMETFMAAEGLPHDWNDALDRERNRVLGAMNPK